MARIGETVFSSQKACRYPVKLITQPNIKLIQKDKKLFQFKFN